MVLSEQIIPGSFAFALNCLVDHEPDLAPQDAQFNNDELGASAYAPRVMLKVVLLAYSQGLLSSRTHIAKFVANLTYTHAATCAPAGFGLRSGGICGCPTMAEQGVADVLTRTANRYGPTPDDASDWGFFQITPSTR